jgi:hypothetical protein
MRRPRAQRWRPIGLALAMQVMFWSPGAAASSCPTGTVIGLDPGTWNEWGATLLGGAIGQTFFAPETLISRVTVWRPEINITAVPSELIITEVDTTRTPPRPISSAILLQGQYVFVREGEPGQLIEMAFDLEPPLALPRPGLYAWFIRGQNCYQGETIIVGNNTNPYPDGIYWVTPRVTTTPCYLRPVSGGGDNFDLIFRIEFCDLTTPTRGSTWGEVKIMYR